MLPDLNQLTRIHAQPLISWSTLDGTPITSYWSHTKVRVRESWSESRVESEVVVRGLDLADGGTYTCNAPHARAQPARVIVTVERYGGDGDPKVAIVRSRGMWSTSDTNWREPGSEDTVAASASTAAVLSGAIILVILVIQAALCVFYIKKV
ncbi:hypothetical protein Pcinc_034158 [Petrolisthes cinctipes]|uniref:Ig-like domain-containing protein n=1 Tax=Petrolisthes cinctipes TaxID=88211 RepID=A0AAE1JXV7_PETCI|nr:hypothetical protein Pcinc_034158 [Petrolisthes cinctipes]